MTALGTQPDAAETRRERAARSINHPLTRALLTLTFTTGIVDAVSFLGLGNVFTANMTGNVVFLGFGIAGAGSLPVLAPIVSLLAFLIGAAAGGVLADRLAEHHPVHVARSLAIEVVAFTGAGILAAALDVRAGDVAAHVLIATLAFAMGVRNATTSRIAVPDLTTTVLTRTITGLATSSPLIGGSGKGAVRRSAAVLAMLAGAVAGALMVKSSLVLPLLVAAALALATWLLYVPAARRGA
jgi:uncharacterized membrane protein YoaK (UPF0700 family)